ncbi:MAG: heme o synthase [Neomegalonema sp.]|nr:heme o synthase [Neomegalonema sp.]
MQSTKAMAPAAILTGLESGKSAFQGQAAMQPLPSFRDYFDLLKPRVMALVVFTAFIGLLAAPDAVHPVVALAGLLCVAIGAGASGALNMWYDADIDRLMDRTKGRPIPSGRVEAWEALALGIVLSVASVLLLGLFTNWVAALMLGVTIAFYIFVYTMWLKRWTSQNIVIGGAAGAFPPMIGWAIATGGISAEAIILFAIIFLWTPPHSWALALFRNADYTRVHVPMLPVAAGDAETRRQLMIYTVLLVPAALAPLATPIGGLVYAAIVVPLTIKLLKDAWSVARRQENQAREDKFRAEKKFFGFTILWLFLVFVALGCEALLRMAGIATSLVG